ncbi:hypothetical protein [Legionella cardiaca]|uniref:Uncharacterized protein n=1 Tax=Legionella cardiaca TaxID=1071983 RepID=A0ABY8AWM7_9GAMM|nr:hypothetical protein [Legionella cardiaca]WED43557.1 hypothetical protein PXX05_01925 [Legionella cardiaca]
MKDFLTSEGKCFAFSIAEGAYSVTGYGIWWRTILTKVENWQEGNLASFKTPVNLNQLLSEAHKRETNERIETLGELVERVLNTAVLEHALAKGVTTPFLPEGIDQIQFLDPDKHFFEIMINKKLLHIQSRDIVGGYFPTPQLADLLDAHKELIAGNICLVHGEDHAINIKYQQGKWIVYDPNYDHDTVENMSKSFDTAENCVKEIKTALRTESIALQLATFDSDKKVAFKFFDELSMQDIIQLIDKGGLSAIARRVPMQFEKIIDLATQSKEVAHALGKALIDVNRANWSGLLVIARYAPLQLERLIKLAQKNEIIAAAIAESLIIPNAQQWNALHMMSSTAANTIPALLELGETNKKVGKALTEALGKPNLKGTTPRELIMREGALKSKILTFELKQGSTKQQFYDVKAGGATKDEISGSDFKPQTQEKGMI